MPGEPVLFLRADAGGRTASGHVVRSFALAQAWRALGGRAVMVVRRPAGDMPAAIVERGLEILSPPASHPDPADAAFCAGLIARQTTPWVACDGYHFDAAYTSRLAGAGARILVIDDLADSPVYDADVILNQNIFAERLEYRCARPATLLAGPDYALLRREFCERARIAPEIPARASRILVTMGGSDPGNFTARVLRSLGRASLAAVQVRALIGNTNPHHQKLEEEARSGGFPSVEFVSNPRDMMSLLSWADLAISAAGSTCYELCYLGIPMILIALADNQDGIASGLDEAGAAINIGRPSAPIDDALDATAASLVADQARRAALSMAGYRLVDGRGAERVARVLR